MEIGKVSVLHWHIISCHIVADSLRQFLKHDLVSSLDKADGVDCFESQYIVLPCLETFDELAFKNFALRSSHWAILNSFVSAKVC